MTTLQIAKAPFSDKNLEIHNLIVYTPSIMQLILSHHLASTSCWAFSSASTCLKKHVLPNLHPVSDVYFDTREDAKIYVTGFFHFFQRHGISLLLSKELSSLLPVVFEGFSPPSSVLAFELGAGEGDRPFRL